ncbi:hypothetical protein SRHO_G00171450 [Serrasalmus rhombeus]
MYPLNIRTLTDDVLDRFASIRIPGSKKERPNFSHMTKHSTSDWSSSLEFEELSSKITSEKEILALFEKMMEDMNLNEDKRVPLREKDLSTKREMVLQPQRLRTVAAGLRLYLPPEAGVLLPSLVLHLICYLICKEECVFEAELCWMRHWGTPQDG